MHMVLFSCSANICTAFILGSNCAGLVSACMHATSDTREAYEKLPGCECKVNCSKGSCKLQLQQSQKGET